MAERGRARRSQGLGQAARGCGLCSQARPERNGASPSALGGAASAAPGPCSLGQLHREPGLSRWPRASSWVLRPIHQAQQPCTGSRVRAPRPSAPLAFLLPRNVSLKDEVTSDGIHNPQAGPTTGAPN